MSGSNVQSGKTFLIRGRRLLYIKKLYHHCWNHWKLLLCYSFTLNLLLFLQRGPWKRLLEKACLYFKGMLSRIIDRKCAQISILWSLLLAVNTWKHLWRLVTKYTQSLKGGCQCRNYFRGFLALLFSAWVLKTALLMWTFQPCCEITGLSVPPSRMTSEPSGLFHPDPTAVQTFQKHHIHEDTYWKTTWNRL